MEILQFAAWIPVSNVTAISAVTKRYRQPALLLFAVLRLRRKITLKRRCSRETRRYNRET